MVSSAVDAHLVTGRLAAALGRGAAARANLRRARELARRAPMLVRLKGHLAAALAARLDRRDRDVLRHCRAGLADLTRHRAALASMELRALASGHGAELGRLGLEVLLGGGSALRVLDWMERTRAAALFAVEPPRTEGIEEELAALRVVHAELAEALRASGGEPPELLARQTAIESRVRRATWARQASVRVAGTPLPAAELRELLGERVLVEYGVLDGQLLAAVVEPERARLVPLGPLDPARYEADALQRVPWSALRPAPVSVAPSASFWARTLQRRTGLDGEVVLVAGPELPGAVDEVGALRRLHAHATVLLPPASTVAAVSDALGGASLAHLACHGRLRADNPTFSSLSLSDGPLTVHELDQRSIAPHRMILAACDSGADVSYEGGEMLGFASALIARGTSGLVTSMVAVPDLEAVPLMRSLHEFALGGAPLAEALHAARGTVDTDHPGAFVNWCALTAFGAA